MTLRCGSHVSAGLLLACWCCSLAAQQWRPVEVPARQDVLAIDDSDASTDNEAEQPSQEGRSFALASPGAFAQPTGPWTGRVLGIPGPESVEKRGVVGLATFTRSIIVQR